MEKTDKLKKKKKKKLKLQLPYYAAVAWPGIHFREKKDCYSHKKTYTNVIAALFIIAKNWKCA